MLTVQTTISSVETDVTKWQQPEKVPWEYGGCTQKRYCHWPGKLRPETTRALRVLARLAVINPASTASPASNCGGATRPSIANTGPLKRKLFTYVPREPKGMRAWIKKWHVQESHYNCRHPSVANANPLPVERQEYNWQKFHCYR